MDAQEIKRVVGTYLVDQEFAEGSLRSGTAERPFRVGLGTGSTAIWAIRRLGELARDGRLKDFVCVATSTGSQLEAQTIGLRVSDLNDPAFGGSVDWAFDGADQVSPEGFLVKGGGAAHAREKLIEHSAQRFVVLVDESKMVESLGGRPGQGGQAIPVEVLPMAIASVSANLVKLGAEVHPRESTGKVGPVVSDNGLVILDAVFPDRMVSGGRHDPALMESRIKALVGVLEVGIFTCPVSAVYVGASDGSVSRKIPQSRR